MLQSVGVRALHRFTPVPASQGYKGQARWEYFQTAEEYPGTCTFPLSPTEILLLLNT